MATAIGSQKRPCPAGSYVKLACGDYSFPLLKHEEALDLIRSLEIGAVDLALMGNRSHIRPELIEPNVAHWIGRLDERLQSRGLAVADVFLIPWTDPHRWALNSPDPADRSRARDLFQVALEVADGLGAAGLTLLPGVEWPGEEYEASLDRAGVELTWRVSEGRNNGVRVSIEPHAGSIVATPEKTLRLLDLCPGLSLTVDYAHFVARGISQDEIDPLLAYVRHFHARAAARGRLQTTLRESEIDFPRVLDLLKSQRYEGYFAIEYVWVPNSPSANGKDITNTDNISETVLLRDLVWNWTSSQPAPDASVSDAGL